MFAILRRIFARKPDPARYEREKGISQSEDAGKRLTLAKNAGTHQEILYYMAEHDPSDEVRMAVVKNKSMPVQASPILAGDRNADVRLALAERLVMLLPDLDQGRQSQLYAFAAQALGTLALDEVLKIRKALSSTLKDYSQTPPKVASQLARDVERVVSEPILRFCAALSDEDLLDILQSHPAGWAVQAIAGREKVSGRVSEAVIATEDRPAGVILLGNEGAEITSRLLEVIVEKAQFYPEWQKPAALHKNLPPAMAQKLAEFADASVRDILLKREDFDNHAIEAVARIFRRRLEYMNQEERSTETPAQRAKRLEKEGRLTEETISDALANRDRDLVCAVLARMVGTQDSIIHKIFEMKASKPIVAISWKAELPMRMALRLQQEVGHVPPKELIYPPGGTDYPLSEDELLWQLEFLGLKAA